MPDPCRSCPTSATHKPARRPRRPAGRIPGSGGAAGLRSGFAAGQCHLPHGGRFGGRVRRGIFGIGQGVGGLRRTGRGQAAGPGGRYITEQTKEAEDRVLVQHQPSDARRTARRARCRRLRRESPVGSRSGRRARAAATVQSAPQPTFAPMVFVLRRAARSPRELVAEHRQAADGCFLCHLVLDDVPVLGQLAVLEAHDIHHDPVRRPA